MNLNSDQFEEDSPEAWSSLPITTNNKNSQLGPIQINNIGSGLTGGAPFSKVTGKANTNIGFDRINQSFVTILETVTEEVPMLPILGSSISNLLFEPADEVLADTLELFVTEALTKLEPRAEILSTFVSLEERNQNKVSLTIEYKLTNTNIAHVFNHTIITGNGNDVL